jgi:2-iminobutanoate/2-iminopropanoate deaminase
MTKEIIRTTNAPLPLGPYSQGVKVGNLLFVSGQAPIDPRTGKIVEGDIEAQTRQTIQNIGGIVEAAGFSMHDIVRVTIFLKNIDDFKRMNEVYKSFFTENPPTRTTVEAKLVSPGMLIAMDAIASH